LSLWGCVADKQKARWRRAGGLGGIPESGFESCVRLVQAALVRRHGMSMMMVAAVMAQALHLKENITRRGRGVSTARSF
jgi:hypothetical protein